MYEILISDVTQCYVVRAMFTENYVARNSIFARLTAILLSQKVSILKLEKLISKKY